MSSSSPNEQQESPQQQQRRQQHQRNTSNAAATAADAEKESNSSAPAGNHEMHAAERQASSCSAAAAARRRSDDSLLPSTPSVCTRLSLPRDRHPYCVVWTYLPCITTLLPVVGHVGICTSEGVVHDFAGSYFISIDRMAFHKPLKVWRLSPALVNRPGGDQAFDAAIEQADEVFRRSCHNLFTNNCHHHVAEALNRMAYAGKENWTPWDVFWNMMTKGHFLS